MSEGYLKNAGAKIWYRSAGTKSDRPVFFLHGGPGHSSYSFEHSVGPLLESRLKMLYVDQRGCGRSMDLGSGAPMTVDAIVKDVEALRLHTGAEKIDFIGHSFGGLIGLEYHRKFPSRVGKGILVDIT